MITNIVIVGISFLIGVLWGLGIGINLSRWAIKQKLNRYRNEQVND